MALSRNHSSHTDILIVLHAHYVLTRVHRTHARKTIRSKLWYSAQSKFFANSRQPRSRWHRTIEIPVWMRTNITHTNTILLSFMTELAWVTNDETIKRTIYNSHNHRMQTNFTLYRNSLLSCPWAHQLLRTVPANTGSTYDKLPKSGTRQAVHSVLREKNECYFDGWWLCLLRKTNQGKQRKKY